MSSNSQTRSGGSGSNESFNSQVSVDDNTFETIETVDTSAEMKEHGSTSARAAARVRLSNPIADDLVFNENGEALGDANEETLDDSMADLKVRARHARVAREALLGSTENWILNKLEGHAGQPVVHGLALFVPGTTQLYASSYNFASITSKYIVANISATFQEGATEVKTEIQPHTTKFSWSPSQPIKNTLLLGAFTLGSKGKISYPALQMYGFLIHINACAGQVWKGASVYLGCDEDTFRLLKEGSRKDLDFDCCLKRVEKFFKTKKANFYAYCINDLVDPYVLPTKRTLPPKKRTADAMNSSNGESSSSSSSSKNNKVPASKAKTNKGSTKNPNKDLIKAMEIKAMEDRNAKKARK